MRYWFGLAALFVGASTASAQVAPPDPSTVTLPDMTPTTDRRDIDIGWAYFYFHKAGVSYADAYADFAECYRFLPVLGTRAELPAFAPWNEPIIPRSLQLGPSHMGLGGDIILAIVSGPLERRAFQGRMRRCMEPRGYVRYPLRREVWEQLIDDYSPASIAMQALAATGPTPNLPQVTR